MAKLILDLATEYDTDVTIWDAELLAGGFPNGSRMSAGDFNAFLRKLDSDRAQFVVSSGFGQWWTQNLTGATPPDTVLDQILGLSATEAVCTLKLGGGTSQRLIQTAINSSQGGIGTLAAWGYLPIPGRLHDGVVCLPSSDGTALDGMAVMTGYDEDYGFPTVGSRRTWVVAPLPIEGRLGYTWVHYLAGSPDPIRIYTGPTFGVTTGAEVLGVIGTSPSALRDGGIAHVPGLGVFLATWDGAAAELWLTAGDRRLGRVAMPEFTGRPVVQPWAANNSVLVSGPTADGFVVLEAQTLDRAEWRTRIELDDLQHNQAIRSDRDNLFCYRRGEFIYWTVDFRQFGSTRVPANANYDYKVSGHRMYALELGTDRLYFSGVLGGAT